MKYFRPDRLAKLQDRSDEGSFLAALAEWERNVDRYKKQLQKVHRELPADLKQLLDTVPLHDARVLDMWWGGRSQFTITLHAQSAPSHLVVLTYSLLEEPTVEKDVLPARVRSETTAWLYDELEFGGDTKRGQATFLHHILLSDGREIRLRFRNVTVKRPVPLVPVIGPVLAKVDAARHSA
jgi:hypothetical protein